MTSQKFKVLIGILIGILAVFFLPLVPVKIPSMVSELGHAWIWQNGLLLFNQYDWKGLFYLELVGASLGILISTPFWKWKSKNDFVKKVKLQKEI